jgi:hypothetical protein
MIVNRRALQDKYKQLRITVRHLERKRDQIAQTEDTTEYFDLCVSIRRANEEIQEILQAL